jgi:hypothetical protein
MNEICNQKFFKVHQTPENLCKEATERRISGWLKLCQGILIPFSSAM